MIYALFLHFASPVATFAIQTGSEAETAIPPRSITKQAPSNDRELVHFSQVCELIGLMLSPFAKVSVRAELFAGATVTECGHAGSGRSRQNQIRHRGSLSTEQSE